MLTKREDLIQAAYETFYKFGFTATGVEQIIQEANVSKRTLYKYFDSKDALINEVINYYFIQFQNFVQEEFSKVSLKPKEKILFVFDVVKKWHKKNKHNGCLVSNAITELSEGDKKILKSCNKFKIFEKDFIQSLLNEADVKNPESLSMTLVMLIEGAIIASKAFGTDDAFDNAKNTTKTILF